MNAKDALAALLAAQQAAKEGGGGGGEGGGDGAGGAGAGAGGGVTMAGGAGGASADDASDSDDDWGAILAEQAAREKEEVEREAAEAAEAATETPVAVAEGGGEAAVETPAADDTEDAGTPAETPAAAATSGDAESPVAAAEPTVEPTSPPADVPTSEPTPTPASPADEATPARPEEQEPAPATAPATADDTHSSSSAAAAAAAPMSAREARRASTEVVTLDRAKSKKNLARFFGDVPPEYLFDANPSGLAAASRGKLASVYGEVDEGAGDGRRKRAGSLSARDPMGHVPERLTAWVRDRKARETLLLLARSADGTDAMLVWKAMKRHDVLDGTTQSKMSLARRRRQGRYASQRGMDDGSEQAAEALLTRRGRLTGKLGAAGGQSSLSDLRLARLDMERKSDLVVVLKSGTEHRFSFETDETAAVWAGIVGSAASLQKRVVASKKQLASVKRTLVDELRLAAKEKAPVASQSASSSNETTVDGTATPTKPKKKSFALLASSPGSKRLSFGAMQQASEKKELLERKKEVERKKDAERSNQTVQIGSLMAEMKARKGSASSSRSGSFVDVKGSKLSSRSGSSSVSPGSSPRSSRVSSFRGPGGSRGKRALSVASRDEIPVPSGQVRLVFTFEPAQGTLTKKTFLIPTIQKVRVFIRESLGPRFFVDLDRTRVELLAPPHCAKTVPGVNDSLRFIDQTALAGELGLNVDEEVIVWTEALPAAAAGAEKEVEKEVPPSTGSAGSTPPQSPGGTRSGRPLPEPKKKEKEKEAE